MARDTRTAATAESTPPESAQMALPSPTCLRMASMVVSMKCAGVQSAFAPQTSSTKFFSSAVPCLLCATSGCHCTAYMLRLTSAIDEIALCVSPKTLKAFRQLDNAVAV